MANGDNNNIAGNGTSPIAQSPEAAPQLGTNPRFQQMFESTLKSFLGNMAPPTPPQPATQAQPKPQAPQHFASVKAAHETTQAVHFDDQFQTLPDDLQLQHKNVIAAPTSDKAKAGGYSLISTAQMDQGTHLNTQAAASSMKTVQDKNSGSVPEGLVHVHNGERIDTYQLTNPNAALANVNVMRRAQGLDPLSQNDWDATPNNVRTTLAKDAVTFHSPTNQDGRITAGSVRDLDTRLKVLQAQPQFEGKDVMVAQMQDSLNHQKAVVANGHDSLLARVGKVAAKVGEIVGATIAPGAVANIPGTELYKQRQDLHQIIMDSKRAGINLQEAQSFSLTADALSKLNPKDTPVGSPIALEDGGFAQTFKRSDNSVYMVKVPTLGEDIGRSVKAVTAANAHLRPEITAVVGLKPVQKPGQSLEEYNRELQGWGVRYATEETRQATQKSLGTSVAKIPLEILNKVGLPPEQAAGESDGEFAARKAKWGGDIEAEKTALAEKAAEARGKGFGQWKPLQAVDAQGNVRWAWAKDAIDQQLGPANVVQKVASQQAQFNDIRSASGFMRDAIKNVTDWGALNTALNTLAQGAKNSSGEDATPYTNAKTAVARQALDGPNRDLVIWSQQLIERAMSLRNVAGMGAASDSLRAAIIATLPTIASGDADFATRQLNAFDNQVDQLETGVLKAKGAPGIQKPKPTSSPATQGVAEDEFTKFGGKAR